MRILVISDTHGHDWRFLDALHDAGKIDAVIFAGDAEDREDLYEETAEVPFYFVAGNNDFYSEAPYDLEFDLCGFHIFLTHGHRYRVSFKPELVRKEARKRHADILIYGHTHRPQAEQDGSLLVLNPGSAAYPRQAGRKPSYILLTLQEGRPPQYQIRFPDI